MAAPLVRPRLGHRAVMRCVEAAAGALVVLEVLVLLTGVVSRYAMEQPLTWTDELASTLFLWLSMFGAVLAYGRSEHMRMGALIGAPGTTRRRGAEALAFAAGLAFILIVMWPAVQYAQGQAVVVTPALEMSDAWRAGALPAGFALMLALAVLRLGSDVRMTDLALALVFIAAIGFVLYLCKPLLPAIGNYRLLLFFVLLVGASVLSGIPIAFAFALGTIAYIAFSTRVPMTIIVGRMDEGMSHLILLSVPLFVFLGYLLELTGMARAMVGFLASLLGHVRGGMQYVLVGAMYLVSGISGAKAADMAAVTPVLFPEMRARGAQPGELVALVAATGAQTETVPPSLVLITIGSVTGVSIAALFTGGLLPSLVLGLLLCVVVRLRTRNETAGARMAEWRTIGRTFIVALPALVLPFVIRTTVMEGIATATEVSTIGIVYCAVYAVLAALFFGVRVPWGRVLWPALVGTAVLTGAILLIIGTATAMAWGLTQSGFSRQFAASMQGLPGGAVTFMAVSIVAFIVLGSVLEGIPAVVLFGPLLFPAARVVGINEVHYAMVVVLAMGVGLFAPPFGVGYYTACAIAHVDPAEGLRPMGGYIVALLAGLVIVAAVPWLSTGFLP